MDEKETRKVGLKGTYQIPTPNGYPSIRYLSLALDSVIQERVNQELKWTGDTNMPLPVLGKEPNLLKFAVLGEEVGEVANALLEKGATSRELYLELTQVAAVAVAWMEALEEIADLEDR